MFKIHLDDFFFGIDSWNDTAFNFLVIFCPNPTPPSFFLGRIEGIYTLCLVRDAFGEPPPRTNFQNMVVKTYSHAYLT